MRLLTLLLAITSAACLRQTTYTCSVDQDCGANGVCDPGLKLCSFADGSCASGFRFSDTAGAHANQCVGGGGPGDDGGVDMPPPGDGDAPPPGDCPGDFVPLPGGSPHVYKVITATDTWVNQAVGCKALSTRAALAVPKTAAEGMGMTMLVGAGPPDYWLGIDDQDLNGVWTDTSGLQAVFEGTAVLDTRATGPWATGEPTSQGGSGAEHCVRALTSTSKWTDSKCDAGNVKSPAVCECAPP